MHQREVGDPQGAGEVDVVDGHAEAGGDGPAVLLPGDGDGQVPRDHHAGDEDPLPDGEARELERLDERRDCNKRGKEGAIEGLVSENNLTGQMCSVECAGFTPPTAVKHCSAGKITFSEIPFHFLATQCISRDDKQGKSWLLETPGFTGRPLQEDQAPSSRNHPTSSSSLSRAANSDTARKSSAAFKVWCKGLA